MTNPSTLVEAGTGPLLTPLAFSNAEYTRRLDGARERMRQQQLDFFISFTPENIYYLTGHDTPGYYYLQACVVSHDHPPIVFTRKIESYNTLGRSWARLACPYVDTQDPVELLAQLLSELGCKGKKIGIESRAWFITAEQHQALTGLLASSATVLPVGALIEDLRAVKSDEELRYIREGAKICSAAMRVAFDATRAGITDNDVAAAAVAELIRRGGEYAGLPPFIMTGPKTALVHSTWSGRQLESGDVLAYELPGVRARYCAALFRTGFLGQPPREISARMEAIIESNNRLIEGIRPGRPIHEVHQISVQAFREHKLPASPRRSAYSLGINYPPDWGEGHIVSFTDVEDRPLEPGMVFHVGVGIFEYPRYQLADSETVIVTPTGHEVVTDFPRELVLC